MFIQGLASVCSLGKHIHTCDINIFSTLHSCLFERSCLLRRWLHCSSASKWFCLILRVCLNCKIDLAVLNSYARFLLLQLVKERSCRFSLWYRSFNIWIVALILCDCKQFLKVIYRFPSVISFLIEVKQLTLLNCRWYWFSCGLYSSIIWLFLLASNFLMRFYGF